MRKVLLFNPRSANYKPRIPNSILSIAASIEGRFEYVIVDGNLEQDPAAKIMAYLSDGSFSFFGCTAMPGPQLRQAIPISKLVRETFPEICIIWGGYFASNHAAVVLQSGYIDFVINGPGDKAFPALLTALASQQSYESINNLVFLKNDRVVKTPKDELYDQDQLPPLPYEKLDRFLSTVALPGQDLPRN